MSQFYFAELSTRLGRWAIAFNADTPSREKLVSLSFGGATLAWKAQAARALSRRYGQAVVLRAGHFEEAASQFEAYATGTLTRFTLRFELTGLSAFQSLVLRELQRVPYGTTVTYGELAKRVGRERGAQAIGGAMGRNPLPVLFPCHRVLAAGSRIGGFTGGLSLKRRLLSLESIDVTA